ncbi:MAG: hypothetical protein V7459_15305 [Oceanicoccus sp.]
MKNDIEAAIGYPIWVYKLVFPFRCGGLVAGVLIFVLVWTVLGLVDGDISVLLKLFFVSMCAYTVPVFAAIIAKTVEAYDEVVPLLADCDEQDKIARHQFTHRSGKWFLGVTLLAVLFCVIHLIALEWSYGRNVMSVFSNNQNASAIGASLVWLLLMTTNYALVENALLLAKLGRRIKIDLLTNSHHVAIARVAIVSTLSIIGAQSLFVLLMIDADANWISFFPGTVITSGPMFVLFLIPVLPLYRRMRDAKSTELVAIDAQIRLLRPNADSALTDLTSIGNLNQLLLYRREIRQVSEWPFDVPALIRLAFYLVLPPLTWVAAALIENVVDTVI